MRILHAFKHNLVKKIIFYNAVLSSKTSDYY